MEVQELQKIFIEILRSELTCTVLDENIKKKLTSETIAPLYKLSKSHDLAHIVSAALGKSELLDNDEISLKFQKQEMLSVYRCEQIKYALEEICKTFDTASIPYIPLKGSVIRPYYPYGSMRTSCDIDILVKEDDLETAANLLINNLNYTGETKGEHDISMHSPNGIHLELHYRLIDVIERLFDDVLNRAWEYAEPKTDSQYKFNDEFLLFYHLSHTSKHFVLGGCGIRPFMDLWIMEHKMGIQRNACDNLLLECGLEKFAEAAFAITDVWFEGKEHTELTKNMQDYIMNAGVYGTSENSIAVSQAKKGNKFKHLLRIAFLSYPQMKIYYPSLQKCPLLFPFYQIRRWIRILLHKDRMMRAITHIKTSNTITDDRRSHIKNLLENLGI